VLSADRQSNYDSALTSRITEAGNVVLLNVINDQGSLQSNIEASAYKVAYSTQYWEDNHLYCPLVVTENEAIYESMGLAMVLDDIQTMGDFIMAGGNVKLPISATDIYMENYEVIDIDSVSTNCALFSNKMVLAGDMRESADGHRIFQPFLTASSISYLLDYKANKERQ
jgi:hypothetical protein